MFHCQVAKDYIVLLDWEARSLCMAATDSIGGFLYNMKDFDGRNRTARHNYKSMIAFMREEKRRSPEAFRTKYVLRDARHPQCLPYFFALADGYRRLKVLIDVPEIEEFNRYASNPALLPDYRPPEYVHLQFLSRRRFVPWKTKVIASQQIRVTEMDHISGTTAEFTLSTSRYVYCFMPEGVEIERRDAVSLGGE